MFKKLGIVGVIAVILGFGGGYWTATPPKKDPVVVVTPKVEPAPAPAVKPTPVVKPAPAVKPAVKKKPKAKKTPPSTVSCETVRRAVKMFSPEHLKYLEELYGITPAQKREYKKCL